MALDNLQVDYLIDPAFQIENLAGKPAVGGHIEVFEAGTDTKVITYQDFDGNVNPFKIPLHSDGRAVILADPSRKYDFYVYDSFNNLMFSRLNVTPNLSGNISIKGCDVYIYNTDGTLDITQQSIQNNIRRYEINTKHKSLGVEAPLYFVEDSDTATIIGFSGDDYATKDYVDSAVSSKLDISSYSSQSGDFLTDKFEYDDDNNITAYNHSAFAGGGGSGPNYEAGDHIDITDNVISVTGLPTSSDIENAISSAVTNVENKFEYNENNYITAYNNSAFAGTNYSAGDYVSIENDTISVTGLQPSGDYATHDDLTAYQPSGDYATKEDVESATSGKQDTLSAGDGITIVNNVISVTSQGGGIEQVNHDDTLSGNGNDIPLGLANPQDYVHQDDLSAYQPSGDYVYRNEMTAYEPAGDYYSASNPSGFLTTADIDNKMDTSAMTAYATTSLVSSISSELYSAVSGISGDYELVGGYGILLTDDDVNKTTTITVTATGQGGGVNSAYVTAAIESATSALVTAISGSYTLVAGTNTELIDNSAARTTTVNVTGVQSSLSYGYNNTAISSLDNSALYDTSAHARINTLANRISNLSSDKLDTSAFSEVSGDFYSTANPSGFITGVDLTPYQTVEGMTAYQEAGDYLSATESANYYPMTGNPSGFLTEHQSLAGYLQDTDLTISDGKITEISGVPLSAGDELPEEVTEAASVVTANSATWNDVTAKQPSGDYYSASNPSGFISNDDIIPISGGSNIDISKVDNKVVISMTGDFATTAELANKLDTTAFSTVSGNFLTAHQDLSNYATTAEVTAKLDTTAFSTVSGDFLTAHQDLSNYATTASVAEKLDTTAFSTVSGNFLTAHQDLSDYATTAALADKLDTSAFSDVSGTFLTAHQDLSDYQTIAEMTAYQPVGDYYSASNPSGFITAVPAGTMNETNFGFNADNEISGYNGSAFACDADKCLTAVSHDSTLSGNGTSASPIGIVKGYNETVLFTANNAVDSITTTEAVTHFERLRIELKSNQSTYIKSCIECQPDAGNLVYTCVALIPAADFPLQMAGVRYTSNNGTQFYFNKATRMCYRPNNTYGDQSTTSLANSDIKDVGYITKIVGINRISS